MTCAWLYGRHSKIVVGLMFVFTTGCGPIKNVSIGDLSTVDRIAIVSVVRPDFQIRHTNNDNDESEGQSIDVSSWNINQALRSLAAKQLINAGWVVDSIQTEFQDYQDLIDISKSHLSDRASLTNDQLQLLRRLGNERDARYALILSTGKRYNLGFSGRQELSGFGLHRDTVFGQSHAAYYGVLKLWLLHTNSGKTIAVGEQSATDRYDGTLVPISTPRYGLADIDGFRKSTIEVMSQALIYALRAIGLK